MAFLISVRLYASAIAEFDSICGFNSRSCFLQFNISVSKRFISFLFMTLGAQFLTCDLIIANLFFLMFP